MNIELIDTPEEEEKIYIVTVNQSELNATYLSLVAMYWSMVGADKIETNEVQKVLQDIMSKITLFKSDGIEKYEDEIREMMFKKRTQQ